jgi:hypothetical protein
MFVGGPVFEVSTRFNDFLPPPGNGHDYAGHVHRGGAVEQRKNRVSESQGKRQNRSE